MKAVEMYATLRNKAKLVLGAMESSTRGVSVVLVLLILVTFVYTSWMTDAPSNIVSSVDQNNIEPQSRHADLKLQPKAYYLTCENQTATFTCPRLDSDPSSLSFLSSSSSTQYRNSPSCPAYFRWIHEDLRPWSTSGITKDMVESARKYATLRLLVVDGKLYVEEYQMKALGRNVFTIWGFLQLLHRYPGRIPDLDLMFSCMDLPAIRSVEFLNSPPPPLFHYCKDNTTMDIVFPDWSFWGSSDQNVKPWELVLKEIEEGNQEVKWVDREPYAFWKGNKVMGANRQDLMKCNISEEHDWNARLYSQDWVSEAQHGFKKSNLGSQCVHRYKIYVEGLAWSVSQKYILACDSPTLIVTPRYDEFFSRGLMPGQHYWPIQENNKCRSVKFAVDWGNKNQMEAQALGQAGSKFIQEQVKMDDVYDYMLHLLTQYAKLLTYKPSVPVTADEYCLESMACPAEGRAKAFMLDSMVKQARDAEPCTMPPPFSPSEIEELVTKRAEAIQKVEKWENSPWDEHANYKF